MVGDEELAEQDSSSVSLARFWRRAENQAQAEGYVDAVVDDVEIRHWELEVTQRVSNVGYVGRQVGSGIEEASFAARPIHDETCLIHHRHHHHPYPFPSH